MGTHIDKNAPLLTLIDCPTNIWGSNGWQQSEFSDDQQLSILLAGGLIVGILSKEQRAHAVRLGVSLTVQAAGCIVVPGLVDLHVHVTGGGGEAGPASRTPESQLSALLDAGITTVVGLLGTDCYTRRQENLVAKCRALSEEGITAYHWAGSYRVPPATVTGSIQQDMCFIESCIGVGEIAVSDHRSSCPTPHELARIASEARVGGMLSGKAGVVHVHMGDGPTLLEPLSKAVAHSDMPITQFLPTHMERNLTLVEAGIDWIHAGGNIDFTAGDKARAALRHILTYKPGRELLQHCSVSSDSFGSLPVFDHGKLVEYKVADPKELLQCLRDLHFEDGLPLEQVLPLFTSQPAVRLKLSNKGCVAPGKDADLLLLDESSLELRYVFAKGVLVKTPDWTRGGLFERGPHIRPREL